MIQQYVYSRQHNSKNILSPQLALVVVSILSSRSSLRDAVRACQVGDIKFGDLKGEDSHGNKYFENKEYPYGERSKVDDGRR